VVIFYACALGLVYFHPLVISFILICILGLRRAEIGMVSLSQFNQEAVFLFYSGALINKYEHQITFGPRGEKARTQ